jgi:hypothetical protein
MVDRLENSPQYVTRRKGHNPNIEDPNPTFRAVDKRGGRVMCSAAIAPARAISLPPFLGSRNPNARPRVRIAVDVNQASPADVALALSLRQRQIRGRRIEGQPPAAVVDSGVREINIDGRAATRHEIRGGDFCKGGRQG